ncbi:desi-like protein at4g17486-like protein [Trifolium pratense]|uniref:Desi-like protein at4g17486-like protein n=1 Tax=Trifolium pratense TaxID=57577 RepID=A0A2K3NBY8_TRIPR|nr:desi-like protein at4g17486-like protein [Trifolium pratense]
MLFCGKGSRNGVVLGSVPVYLNVYDLTQFNGYAYWFGLGVYHSGVQVHDVEYAFGAHEHASTGIFEGEPKKCEGFRYRKTILIGKTDKDIDEVRDLMIELAAEYKGNAYNLITKNCSLEILYLVGLIVLLELLKAISHNKIDSLSSSKGK